MYDLVLNDKIDFFKICLGALIDKIKFGAVEVGCLSGQDIDAFDYRYRIY